MRIYGVKNERGQDAVKGVSFFIRSGEIFGIAGVSGNGQKEIEEAIAGLRKTFRGRGLDKGAVGLAPFNDAIPEDVRNLVNEELQKYLNKEVPEQYPFLGPIYNQKGELVKAESEVMSDEELLSMNFFIDNVVGRSPIIF